MFIFWFIWFFKYLIFLLILFVELLKVFINILIWICIFFRLFVLDIIFFCKVFKVLIVKWKFCDVFCSCLIILEKDFWLFWWDFNIFNEVWLLLLICFLNLVSFLLYFCSLIIIILIVWIVVVRVEVDWEKLFWILVNFVVELVKFWGNWLCLNICVIFRNLLEVIWKFWELLVIVVVVFFNFIKVCFVNLFVVVLVL